MRNTVLALGCTYLVAGWASACNACCSSPTAWRTAGVVHVVHIVVVVVVAAGVVAVDCPASTCTALAGARRRLGGGGGDAAAAARLRLLRRPLIASAVVD